MEQIVCGLIKGRHNLPVDTYIFDDAIEDVHDYTWIRNHIKDFILQNMHISATIDAGNAVMIFRGEKKLICYVTGLTPVTVELVKVCIFNGIHLTLMNYDSKSESYIPEPVI